MKSLTLIMMIVLALAFLVALISPATVKELGHKLHEATFAHMQRSGLVLMAEQVSKQAAKVAAGTKLTGADIGKPTYVVITSPDTVTWANGDTIASPVLIPKGSRPLCGGFASHADMGTSITLDVGLRTVAGVAIDADGIHSALDVATAAARAALNDGALVADGVEYVTTADCYMYATLAGGTPTANAQIRIEVPFLFPS
jgi:hypothetical protein